MSVLHRSRGALLLVLLSATVLVATGCRGLGPLNQAGQIEIESTATTVPTATTEPPPSPTVSTATTAPTATTEPPPSPTVSTATAVPTPTPTSQQSLSATPTASLPSSPVVGARAPGLMLPDLAGNWVSLESLEGKPVLLNFWASW